MIDTDNLLDDEDDDLDDDEETTDLVGSNSQPLWVLPLYSLLTSEKQASVSLHYFLYYTKLLNL